MQLMEQKASKRFSAQDQARTQAEDDSAEEAVRAAQDVIASLNVCALFAGVVSSLPVRPGAYVKSGELLFDLADLRKMQVRVFVDEPDVGSLKIGQAVKIPWDGLPDRTWIAEV